MAYIQSLLAEYGLWLVLIGTFLEGETIVIVAGFASHKGLFDPFHVAALAALGSFTCDQMWFFVARKFGHRPVIQKMKDRPAFARALHFLERHPTVFIFSFRFVYVIRNVSPAVIGLSEIDAHKFFVLNALAAMLWASAFTSIGYLFANSIEEFLGDLHHLEYTVLAILGAGIVVFILYKLARRHFHKHDHLNGQ
ncbi:DedA family protein [Rhodospirillales bacterium]|nr:DedA family protein [Rhodospirillales bacterium]